MPKHSGLFGEWPRKPRLNFWGYLCCFIGTLIGICWLVIAKNPADGIGFWVFVVFVVGGSAILVFHFLRDGE